MYNFALTAGKCNLFVVNVYNFLMVYFRFKVCYNVNLLFTDMCLMFVFAGLRVDLVVGLWVAVVSNFGLFPSSSVGVV